MQRGAWANADTRLVSAVAQRPWVAWSDRRGDITRLRVRQRRRRRSCCRLWEWLRLRLEGLLRVGVVLLLL